MTIQQRDLHVAQRIRESVDIAYRMETGSDGEPIVYLRDGGEYRIWEVVQEALREAGYGVIAITCPACGKPRIVGRACGHCGAR